MDIGMIGVSVVTVIWGALSLGMLVLFAYLIFLVIRALRVYISSKEVREEKTRLKQSLGEALRELRIQNKMTQEFVAQTMGVSRQAVSKWESGISDPSTSNLIALAKLYHTTVEEILQSVGEPEQPQE